MIYKKIKRILINSIKLIKKANDNIESEDFIEQLTFIIFLKIVLCNLIKNHHKSENFLKELKQNFYNILEKQNQNYYNSFLKNYLNSILHQYLGEFIFKFKILNINNPMDGQTKRYKIFVPNEVFNPDKKDTILNFLIQNEYNNTLDNIDTFDRISQPNTFRDDTAILSYLYEVYNEKKRRNFGIFYTNENIANFMSKTILSKFLHDKTGISFKKIVKLFELENNNENNNLNNDEANQILKVIDEVRILDPSMGTGTFLISIFHYLLILRNRCIRVINQAKTHQGTKIDENIIWKADFLRKTIYGFDIDNNSIEIAKLRFIILFITQDITFNLKSLELNFLNKDFTRYGQKSINICEENKCKFDMIIGNPPYAGRGRGVSKEIAKQFNLKSTDIFGIFIANSLNCLKTGGFLSFVTSDTWRTIRSHLPLRRKILENCELKIFVKLPGWIFNATVDTSIFLLKYLPGIENRNARLNSILQTFDLSAIEKNNFDLLLKIFNEIFLRSAINNGELSIDNNKILIGSYRYQQKLLYKYS
ncbi:MAG: Eco57I restriction-modification methylase domain-containing protein, partial [Candidatus Helarchaeota archaeon]